ISTRKRILQRTGRRLLWLVAALVGTTCAAPGCAQLRDNAAQPVVRAASPEEFAARGEGPPKLEVVPAFPPEEQQRDQFAADKAPPQVQVIETAEAEADDDDNWIPTLDELMQPHGWC